MVATRAAGANGFGGNRRFVHQAFLYDSDRTFAERAGAFLRDGLARGEPGFVAVTPHNISLLQRTVRSLQHNIVYVNAADWYTSPGRTLSAYLRRLREHTGPGWIRVIGEPRWIGRTPSQILAWQRYESVINMTLAGSSAWILCPYDTRVLPRDVVEGARRTHPEIVDRHCTAQSDAYVEPIAFSAECDQRPLAPPRPPVTTHYISRSELRRTRRLVVLTALDLGLNGERLDDFATSVQEIATNVVEHGGGDGTARVWLDGNDVVCDVIDRGADWNYHAIGHHPPSPDSTSGLGVWIARRLCDQVEIRTGPNGSLVRLRMARA
ncbi:sensor histidine kinase [Actinomadura rudentiformis]|uniref:Sensor histidine kinase n=1 Tax=Actinomadura rudentiformis TaxID=359158 RepID=A0A6H9YXB6_9ACTN|nr:sensor histidine kinase [Actinomadura rudentiformis]KAB2344812.1 sensor histidine kinase [Actinomadura rudentiformis]